jgi:hypothetical protein
VCVFWFTIRLQFGYFPFTCVCDSQCNPHVRSCGKVRLRTVYFQLDLTPGSEFHTVIYIGGFLTHAKSARSVLYNGSARYNSSCRGNVYSQICTDWQFCNVHFSNILSNSFLQLYWHLKRLFVIATGLRPGRSGARFPIEQDLFIFSRNSRPAVRPTQWRHPGFFWQ